MVIDSESGELTKLSREAVRAGIADQKPAWREGLALGQTDAHDSPQNLWVHPPTPVLSYHSVKFGPTSMTNHCITSWCQNPLDFMALATSLSTTVPLMVMLLTMRATRSSIFSSVPM